MTIRRAITSMTPYVPGERRPGAIKLSSNENPWGPSPRALEAIRAAAADIHRYPDGGATALREAIARHHDCDPENVLVGNGSDETMLLIAATYVEPNDIAVFGQHTFSQYRFVSTLLGGTERIVPMPNLQLDLADVAAAAGHRSRGAGPIAADGSDGTQARGGPGRGAPGAPARIVFLCTPNNPTGLTLPDADVRAMLASLGPETVVVVDHAYQEYVDDPAALDGDRLFREDERVVVLHTFSKIYGLAGLRLGYVLAHRDRIAEIARTRMPFNANSVAQAAAIAALDDREWTATCRTRNAAGRERVEAVLAARGLAVVRGQGNFVCAEIGDGARAFATWMADHGATVRHLASFGLPGHVRISVGTDDEVTTTEALITRWADEMSGAQARA